MIIGAILIPECCATYFGFSCRYLRIQITSGPEYALNIKSIKFLAYKN